MFRKLGQSSFTTIRTAGGLALFSAEALWATFVRAFSLRRILFHIYEIGARTTPLILMVSFFAGLVLGIQAYFSLVRFGSESALGSLVSLSIVRELGPVLTAVMVVGQAGSAISAQIGMERNSEQIDALRVMRIPPMAYLIGPRLVASLLCYPILTGFFNWVGIFGGKVAAVDLLSMDSGVYWSSVRSGITPDDVCDSLIKAVVFGFLTMLVCCFEGYYTHERSSVRGARGVNESATRAVVISSVLILLSDYLITSYLV